MSEDSAAGFVCAVCGWPIGVYEPCLVETSEGPAETSLLSLNAGERRGVRAKGVYHTVCYPEGAEGSTKA